MGPYSTDKNAAAAAAAAAATAAAAAAASSSLEDSSSSTRSFFSRLGLPLRTRGSRNLADFHIRPVDPHRNYAAGDHVHGAVLLTLLKPIRITHLTVALRGYVRVFKGASSATSEPAINAVETTGATGASSRSKYYGNGHASLFQDEQVLSGDGRLEAGKYEFNFDLMFPSRPLPSSIDFERGTIAYVITATLTRPTAISPTVSCDRRIQLIETVDVGSLTPPRPRTIYLEPISKRSRRKRLVEGERPLSEAIEAEGRTARRSESAAETTEGSHSGGTDDQSQDSTQNNPRSPVQSDLRSLSGESAVSVSTGLSRGQDGVTASSLGTLGGGGGGGGGHRNIGVEDRTITATIELLKGGCLPGDVVPVKISVQHIKRIKSMHGVIVTLYRQGRIDSSPPISLFRDLSKEEAKKLEKEEYYPKSRTGLGGLSLTSAGPCSVFRKDLSQAFSPLLIDPATLTTSINTSVRVPPEAFPTIKGVPGEMISFKYQVEVIVDLGGKLAGQLQGGNASMGMGLTGPHVSIPGQPFDGGASSVSGWGPNPSIIDTDRLRREKGVISVVFEVVVGTVDTARREKRGKEPANLPPSTYTRQIPESDLQYSSETQKGQLALAAYPEDDAGPVEYSEVPREPPLHPYWNPNNRFGHEAAPVYVPPPDVPNESDMTEKDRIRRAEQRLLPSQPEPDAASAGPSGSAYLNGVNIYDAEDAPQAAQASSSHAPNGHPAAAVEPSAPALEDLAGPSNNARSAADDKQELERARLLAEASAPPEFPDDYEAEAAGPSSSAPTAPPLSHEPSAPVLHDESYGAPDEYNRLAMPQASAPPGEQLPKYER